MLFHVPQGGCHFSASKNWPAIKAHFQSIGKKEITAIIWCLIGYENGEVAGNDMPSIPLLHLYFLKNCLPILTLECVNLVAVELFKTN